MTEFLYDGLKVLQEITGKNKQKKANYYRANGRIIIQQKYNISQGNNDSYQHRPEGRQLYYTYDGLGSVASLTNHKSRRMVPIIRSTKPLNQTQFKLECRDDYLLFLSSEPFGSFSM